MTEWREVPSRPGVLVSDDGQVLSFRRGLLKQTLHRDGYLFARVGGWGYVHQLVCEAFHGPRPSPIHQVAHNDGDKFNNHADNLRWATPKENCDDRRRHGVSTAPNQWRTNVLTPEQREEVRERYAAGGVSMYKLAAEYGIARESVRYLINGDARHGHAKRPPVSTSGRGGS